MYILHKNQIAKKKHESFLIGEKKQLSQMTQLSLKSQTTKQFFILSKLEENIWKKNIFLLYHALSLLIQRNHKTE